MKTLALRIAALLLAAAATAPAFADILFDNIDSTTGTQSWRESYPPWWTDRRYANRIPVGTNPMRIESVTMDVDSFDGLEMQVCEVSASGTAPDPSRCATFTPDQTANGRRTFSGSRDIGWGNTAWVVLRSRGPGFSTVRVQSHSDYAGRGQQTDNGTDWIPSRRTTYGMRISGTPLPVTGTCGSASGTSTVLSAPVGEAACNPGTLYGMTGLVDRFTWQCLGWLGGGNSPQCSAPRGYNVYASATGGGIDPPSRLVTAGESATFTLTIPPGHEAAASGCGGSLSGNVFTTAPIYDTCRVTATFALKTYPIATPAATGGTVSCTPNPVTHGQNASCTATPDAGYRFSAWTGDCSGSGACTLTNVTGPRSVSATFTLLPVDGACGTAANLPAITVPQANLCATGTPDGVLSASGQYTWQCLGEHGGTAQQCSAPWADAGRGTGTVQVDGSGGWHIRSAAFTNLPAALPPGAQAVHAPLALTLEGGTGPAQVTVTFTEPAPAGAVYLKYGPSREGLGCTGVAACAQPHWYALPGAAVSADRTQVTLRLTDGGDGDSDGAADGRITDPGLPVLLAAQAVPTLSAWPLALLAAALAWLVARRKHLF